MSYLTSCYLNKCGEPETSGYAEISLSAATGATYEENGKSTSIACGSVTKYSLSGTGCWISCNLLRNDLIQPPGSFYNVSVYTGGVKCEQWVVKIDSQTPTGIPVDVRSVGQRINPT